MSQETVAEKGHKKISVTGHLFLALIATKVPVLLAQNMWQCHQYDKSNLGQKVRDFVLKSYDNSSPKYI